jgi:hypothetical protein
MPAMRRALTILALCLAPLVQAKAQGQPAIAARPVAFRAPLARLVVPTLPAGTICRAAIAAAERGGGTPPHLMAAIGRVESGRRDPETGAWNPWPWTINAEGQGFFYDTKAQAIAAVKDLQAKGVHSIDVGCMQINLMHHPDAFASLEQAFDPMANARYAARFLNQLHDQTNDWAKATGFYHSGTPELAADYLRRVQAALPEEAKRKDMPGMAVAALPELAEPTGRVAVALPLNRMENIRIMPVGQFGVAPPPGRGLDSYRATPIAIASQSLRIGG